MAPRLLKPAPGRPFRASAEALAPAATAWEILTDTTLWSSWGPSVRSVRCDERWLNAGVTGAVQLSIGPWLSFVIERFEPPFYWDWRVAGLHATGHRIEALGASRCRISFEFSAWAAPYYPVCRIAAVRVARLAAERHAADRV